MERLQKYAADCGLMSRRAAEKEILQGNFTVNGETARIGMSVDPEKDNIEYKGKTVLPRQKNIYIMLNKPQDILTTADDELGRKTVCDLVDIPQRLHPVGRLDKNSEGLILLTNDGDFTLRLTHPRYENKKTYHVTADGFVTDERVDFLNKLTNLEGETIIPVKVRVLGRDGNTTKLEFILREGKNRQIRRMCLAAGFLVKQLKRVSVGVLELGNLEIGKWRHLTAAEVKELKNK